MKITTVNGIRTEILLSPEEQKQYHISYQSISYAQAATKQFIVRLIEDVSRLGYRIDMSGKTLIEVISKNDGSLLVAFTCLTGVSPKHQSRDKRWLLIFHKKDIPDRCLTGLSAGKKGISLYAKGDYRYLIITETEHKNKALDFYPVKGTVYCTPATDIITEKCKRNLICLSGGF